MQKKKNKKKSKNNNLGFIMACIGAFAAVVAVGYFVLTQNGYTPNGYDPGDGEGQFVEIYFYFPSASGEWGREARQIEIRDDMDMIAAVIRGIVNGPADATALTRPVPPNVIFQQINLHENGQLDVSFSDQFHNISHSERVVLMASAVHTLTGLNFVVGINFFVENEPVMGSGDEIFGLRTRENTILGGELPTASATIITLYFPNLQMTGLVAELREIEYNPLLTNIETTIVQALIEGPRAVGLDFGLPPTTALYAPVDRSGELLFVNFTGNFLTDFGGGSLAEEMMIFSLVNTLTEMEGTNYVQIFIDGLPIPYDGSPFHMELHRPIARNESEILR